MVTITYEYTGQLGTKATHGPSGTTLSTDAPVDNAGRGLSFSPTDLLATSLATCALTTMAIAAQKNGIAFDAGHGAVVKVMTTAAPRRVAALTVTLRVPTSTAATDRELLEAAGRKCPVALSLHPDVKVEMTFDWSA